MQKLTHLLARRRSIYSVLIGIILLTVPCYIIGAIALAIAPRDNSAQSALRVTATSTVTVTATVFARGTLTPFAGPSATLADLPVQFVPSTLTLTATASPIASMTPAPPPLPQNVKPGKPGKRGK